MANVIIAGGREFNNYTLLKEKCDYYLNYLKKDIVIFSGKARGADSLGEIYAKENDIPVKEFPADWDKYDKKAGHIRNSEMAKEGNFLIAFWDGKSKGTLDMIKLAFKYKLKVRIVRY